jgi:nucleotide-binding universal stress UspA family protein
VSRVRRILHPTDFSRASSAAFNRAVDMAKGNRAAAGRARHVARDPGHGGRIRLALGLRGHGRGGARLWPGAARRAGEEGQAGGGAGQRRPIWWSSERTDARASPSCSWAASRAVSWPSHPVRSSRSDGSSDVEAALADSLAGVCGEPVEVLRLCPLGGLDPDGKDPKAFRTFVIGHPRWYLFTAEDMPEMLGGPA